MYQITRTGEVKIVAETPSPNGLALSPNQQHLYVAGYQIGAVRIYPIEPDGRLGPGQEFAPITVDGLKTDEAGNVWMASLDGIHVHTKNAEPLGVIKTPERPTNCGWGGSTLYITTPSTVFQIPTKSTGTRTF